MKMLITAMDGFELHLYVDEEYLSFLDFDSLEDAIWAKKIWKNWFNTVGQRSTECKD